MSDNAVQTEEKIGKIWTVLEKLKGVVLGNGTEGHEQRIQNLEERTEPKNCIGKQALEQYVKEIKDEKRRKRSFRAGDIANWIQLLVLLLMAYQVFWG